jgi:hypothetical protein
MQKLETALNDTYVTPRHPSSGQRAAVRLQAIQSTLESAPSFDPEIGFYTARADIAMQRTDSTAAESAIRSAVCLAEWALT